MTLLYAVEHPCSCRDCYLGARNTFGACTSRLVSLTQNISWRSGFLKYREERITQVGIVCGERLEQPNGDIGEKRLKLPDGCGGERCLFGVVVL